jgi:uncharacterized protein (TIGR03382 family)
MLPLPSFPRALVVAHLLALGALVPAARADLVVPERAACDGKAVGDACDGGSCVSAGFECQAGACRQYGAEAECRNAGCRWEEQIVCSGDAPPPPAPNAPPSAPSSGAAASCAAVGVDAAGLAAVGALLGLARRRRRP